MNITSRPSAFLSALQEEGTKSEVFNYLVRYYWDLDAAEAENKRLRQTLEFYARSGDVARQALEDQDA